MTHDNGDWRLPIMAEEAEQFWNEIGAIVPMDSYPVSRCPVCGNINSWDGPCSIECRTDEKIYRTEW